MASKARQGLSGGRAGGGGYSYQDAYVAWQLSRMLTGGKPHSSIRQVVSGKPVVDLESPTEVLWEKTRIDLGPSGVVKIWADDFVLQCHDATGKQIVFGQVKENAPAHRWTIKRFVDEGVAEQFARQWTALPVDVRPRCKLRFVSRHDFPAMETLMTAANTSRTTRELFQGQSKAVKGHLRDLLRADGVERGFLLPMLQAIEFERVHDPIEPMHFELQHSVDDPINLANQLVEIVTTSKRRGAKAQAFFTPVSLMDEIGKRNPPLRDVIARTAAATAIRARPVLADLSQAEVDEWNAGRESGVYIQREKIEADVLNALDDGIEWISIEGDAGTGKTTLTRRLMGQLHEQSSASGTAKLPVFVDCQWLSASGSLADSPLAPLRDVIAKDCSPLDALLGVANVVAPVPLVVLLDTVDAGLLTSWRDRICKWLASEARCANIQVVSCCRPLEAQLFSRERRKRVRLLDFSIDEARRAIDAYVDSYYESPAIRQEARGTLRAHLAKDATFEDVCRRPVTLRMLFEVYHDRPPSEVINRSRLYDEYWRAKVRADQSQRRHRAVDAANRVRLAKEMALQLAEVMEDTGSTGLLIRDVDNILDEQPEGSASLHDLVSEGVLHQSGTDTSGLYSFFHQSFLEYAAARAALACDDADRRDRLLRTLLEPVINNSGTPWFDLLKELAVQGQLSAAHRRLQVTERVLECLQQSAVPGAAGVTASIWCHLPHRCGTLGITQTLLDNPVFRDACLTQLHNAGLERIPDLLDQFVRPAWSSNETRERVAAIDACARTAPIAPNDVQAVISQLDFEAAAFAESKDNTGPFVERVIRLYAAFLGADDDFAGTRLRAIYGYLEVNFVDAALRSGAVEVVGARLDVTPLALELLCDWLQRPNRSDTTHWKQLQESFARVHGKREPDEELADIEARIMGSPTAGTAEEAAAISGLRKRVITIRRDRIMAGLCPWSTFWDDFTSSPDPALVADLGGYGIIALAKRRFAPMFEKLLDLMAKFIRLPSGRTDVTDTIEAAEQNEADAQGPNTDAAIDGRGSANAANDSRQQHCIRALEEYAADSAFALAILRETQLSQIPFDELKRKKLAPLFVRIVSSLAPDDAEAFVGEIIKNGNAFDFLTLLSPGIAPAIPVRIVLEAVREARPGKPQGQLARQLAANASGLSPAVANEAAEWLTGITDSHAGAVCHRALEALPPVLKRCDDVPLVERLLLRVSTRWPQLQRDGDAARFVECLANGIEVFADRQGSLELQQSEHEELVGILHRQAVTATARDSTDWSETRRAALRLTSQLGRLDLQLAAASFADFVMGLQEVETAQVSGEELRIVVQFCYAFSQQDRLACIPLLIATCTAFDRCNFGQMTYRKFLAALKGAIRVILDREPARSHFIGSASALPNSLQVGLVSYGKNQDDDDVFNGVESVRLCFDAAKIHQAWSEQRFRKAAPG